MGSRAFKQWRSSIPVLLSRSTSTIIPSFCRGWTILRQLRRGLPSPRACTTSCKATPIDLAWSEARWELIREKSLLYEKRFEMDEGWKILAGCSLCGQLAVYLFFHSDVTDPFQLAKQNHATFPKEKRT